MTASETGPSAKVLNRPLFLWSLPFAFLYFGLPVISKDLGASAAEIGGLFSVFTATTLLLRPVVGWLLDRISAKIFLFAALCIYGAAMLAFAFAESLGWLYAARIIQGVGSALLWTSTYTIVAGLTAPAERGRAMGQLNEITTRGGLVGIFAAFMLMSILPAGLAWRTAFTGFAGLTWLGAFLAWRTTPKSAASGSATAGSTTISSQLLRLLMVVFIMGIPEAMLNPLYLTYLQDRFTTNMETLAWAFFPAGVVTAIFSARLGSLSDKFGRVPMMAVGLAGAGITTLLMPHLPTLVWLAVVYTITAVMWAVSEPAETALVGDLTGHQRRGLAYGLYDFVENIGFTIGPLLGGIVYDQLGHAAPFYLSGGLLVGGAMLVLILLQRRARNASVATGN